MHVAMYGATCATTLSLPSDISGPGRIAIANSWFGSVKTAIILKESGSYSIKLLKKVHEQSSQESLDSLDFAVGKWVAYTANLGGVEVHAVSFQDLSKKQVNL